MSPARKLKRPEELLGESAARLRRNSPGMSLRAVAARLGISPSYWSKILNGKKPLPQRLLTRVIQVLALDTQQTALLQRSILGTIEEEHLRPVTGLRTNGETDSPVHDYRDLDRTDHWLLESWYFIPILNLFTLKNFKANVPSIAERLGLNAEQVQDAVARLRHHGFLTLCENGELVRGERKARIPTTRSHREVRNFHRVMIDKARNELAKEDGFDSRLITSISLAGSSAKVNEARLILEEAIYRAANLMADAPESDDLFQINLQFFPLSKPAK